MIGVNPSIVIFPIIAMACMITSPPVRAISDDSPPFVLDTRNFGDTATFPVDTRGPDILANTGITDPGGGSFTVTMAMLNVTGGNDGMDAITFTLATAPIHGTLILDGVPLAAGAMFTQEDIDNGLLQYQRAAGRALTDSFELSALDEGGFGLAGGSFFFAVAGLAGDAGALFLVDTRNYTESPEHAVHTSSTAHLAMDTIPGSLRQAIANTDSGGTVTLDTALDDATVILTSGPLVIDSELGIDNSAIPGGLTLSGNQSVSILHVAEGGIVSLDRVTLTDGKSGTSGGAIVNDGDLTLTNVTVTNSASFFDGGAILNASSGTLTLINSTVAGNLALDAGGGIFSSGDLVAIHSTISDNEAFFLGGGGIFKSAGTLALENTIVAGNFAATDDNLNTTPDTATGNNFTSGDSRLAPLGDYGGATPVMPPLPGSPAIEGAILLGATPALDQLGRPRPIGPLPDMGAVEGFPFSTLPLVDTDDDGIDDRLEPAFPQFTVGVDDSALDTDGDGSPDAEELANMTDLLDPDDYLQLLSMIRDPDFHPITNPGFTVTMTTFPGLSYQLDSSSNLTDFQMIPGTAFIADDFTAAFEITLSPQRGFVRATRTDE